MKIAIMSDIHDNIWNLERALQQVQEQEAQALLFLGDFCAPFTLDQLARGFSGPIHAILGNNDGDPLLLSRIAGEHSQVTLHGHFAELTFEGVKIALNHYPEIARGLAHSRLYDAVFSGHDHQRYQHTLDQTLWANPGEVMGRFGKPSFGLFHTGARSFSHIDIDLSRRVAGQGQ
ncbi:phosphodiesterase [Alkalispirochaeta sphaeroplastigenens]|uniref:Phosphoesterase n=1 Tax=Alkalispirochaeta sphaeroplastigenens TaxID=1187066 RepID=A0A2S4JPP5_9SPIO|nr:YfcE family phosphodiesterase [Alkalispirochaeta sphaeroplastigenens]POR01517.1 phosphodiesterase [Alkalispirochaeta sphaeroplastigenens]